MTAPRDLDGPARPLTSRPLSRGDLRLLVLSLLVTPAAAAMRVSASVLWVPVLSVVFAIVATVGS